MVMETSSFLKWPDVSLMMSCSKLRPYTETHTQINDNASTNENIAYWDIKRGTKLFTSGLYSETRVKLENIIPKIH